MSGGPRGLSEALSTYLAKGADLGAQFHDLGSMIRPPSSRVFDFLFDNVVGEVVVVMAAETGPARGASTVMHVRCPDRLPEETYRQVLEQLADLSPVVQALPPTAALVELKGALRCYGTGACRLGEVLRIRALSRLGVDVRVGIGLPSRSPPPPPPRSPRPAASSRSTPTRPRRGSRRCRSRPCTGSARARPKPCTTTASSRSPARLRHPHRRPARRRPHRHRAASPRGPGRAPGRRPRPWHRSRPGRPPDPAPGSQRPSRLHPAHPGRRRRGQAARSLNLTLRFAGGATWERTRRLPEGSGHDEDLRTVAYQLMDAAGLQRGRLTGIALKGGDLVDAGQVAQQISLDHAREARLAAEEAVDRIRDKFGPGVIGPAVVFPRAS